ncbi:hypothetical protein BMS3Abin15_00333 [bacterium BMS3Abin15]|nr:hypothetical protein BMS3Abin15_00333 [bacterium BMS3Abin15]
MSEKFAISKTNSGTKSVREAMKGSKKIKRHKLKKKTARAAAKRE